MSASFIPSVKDLATHLTEETCRVILRRALTLRTTAAVKRYMAEQLHLLAPNLDMLDMA